MATRAQTNDSESEVVCPRYILFQSSKQFSSAGEHPTVCKNEKFVIAVSAGYYRSGTLFYALGTTEDKTVTWKKEKKIELDGNCSFPSVAATSEGVVLLAYVKSKTSCYYTIGTLTDDDDIEWSQSNLIDDGRSPSISLCIEDNNTHMVVFAFITAAKRGYTRVGTLDLDQKAIRWNGEKYEISPFSSDPSFNQISVALSPNKEIVIAYRWGYRKIVCQIGNFTMTSHGECIEFSSTSNDNLYGCSPSISINKKGHILIIFQSIMGRKLMCQSGVVQPRGMGEGIVWKDRTAELIDYGCYPSVTLADNDTFIELHGSNFGASLHYRIGEIQI